MQVLFVKASAASFRIISCGDTGYYAYRVFVGDDTFSTNSLLKALKFCLIENSKIDFVLPDGQVFQSLANQPPDNLLIQSIKELSLE